MLVVVSGPLQQRAVVPAHLAQHGPLHELHGHAGLLQQRVQLRVALE